MHGGNVASPSTAGETFLSRVSLVIKQKLLYGEEKKVEPLKSVEEA
jgi:hypothetical protein